MAKITIFGLAGTGTTTLGKMLAKKLECEFVSTGKIFRAKAASLSLDLYQFEKLCNEDYSYDRAIEDEIGLYGKQHDNFVLESRLGWYSIPDSFKIKVICDFETRIKRVADRDNIPYKEAEVKTLFRENSHIERYAANYGITDFGADHYFDVIIDSTEKNPEHMLQIVVDSLR